MASRIAEAYVQIVPRIDGVASQLKGQLSGEMGKAGEESGKSFGGRFKSIIGPAVGLAAAAAIGNFAKGAIVASQEAAVADKRLTQVAKSMNIFGGETDGVVKRLQDFASTTMRSIGVDDEVIKSTQTKLLTFKDLAATADTAGGAFDRATKAAFDLASAGFGTAEGNAVQLGKALQDPIKGISALTRSGVTFTDAEKARIKTLVESNKVGEAQNMILSAIETQVGGTAEATVTGTEKMKVAFGELQENVGNSLAPAFETLVTALIPVIDELGPILADVFAKLAPVFLAIARILPTLGSALGALAPILGIIFEALAEIVEAALPIFMELVEALIPIIQALIPPVLQVVKALLPIIPAVLGIVTAFLPLVQAVLPLLVGLIQFLAPILKTVADIISKVVTVAIKFLTDGFKGLIAFLPKVFDAFSRVFKNIANFVINIANGIIGSIEGLVNFIIDGINFAVKALNSLKWTVPDWVPIIGGSTFSLNLSKLTKVKLGRIPKLAEGGYVDRATTAIIGEAGPEVVTPLKDFERMMGLDKPNADRPIYADGIGLIGWIREVANGEAKLVFNTELNKVTRGAR